MDRRGLWTLRKPITDDQFKDPFVILKTLISAGQVSAIIRDVWAEGLCTKQKWAGAGEAATDWGFKQKPGSRKQEEGPEPTVEKPADSLVNNQGDTGDMQAFPSQKHLGIRKEKTW